MELDFAEISEFQKPGTCENPYFSCLAASEINVWNWNLEEKKLGFKITCFNKNLESNKGIFRFLESLVSAKSWNSSENVQTKKMAKSNP